MSENQATELTTVQTRKPYRPWIIAWLAVTFGLSIIAGVGVVVFTIGERLSETAFNMIVGGAIVLGVAVIFSVIFIG